MGPGKNCLGFLPSLTAISDPCVKSLLSPLTAPTELYFKMSGQGGIQNILEYNDWSKNAIPSGYLRIIILSQDSFSFQHFFTKLLLVKSEKMTAGITATTIEGVYGLVTL